MGERPGRSGATRDSLLQQETLSLGQADTVHLDQKPYLESCLVPLPPLPEQKAIAHVLSTVQRAREATEAVIVATRELKKSLMRHLFAYGPVPLDQIDQVRFKETESGPVPEHWEIQRLADTAAIERGKFTHRPRNDPEFYGGAIPFIQTGDVTLSNGHVRHYSQTLNANGLAVSRIFPKGTIVITIAANIGYTGILDFDSAFPDSLVAISPQDKYSLQNAAAQSHDRPREDRRCFCHLLELIRCACRFLCSIPTCTKSPERQVGLLCRFEFLCKAGQPLVGALPRPVRK